MSLLTKTTILFLGLALLVFGIAGIVTYRTFVEEIQIETDWYLDETFNATARGIKTGIPIEALDNGKVHIRLLTDTFQLDTLAHYKDTLAQHFNLHRLEPHRNLTRVKKIAGAYYQISITDVLIELDDMSDWVFGVMSRLFFFLSASLILGSFLVSRWLFTPFVKLLNLLSSFNLKNSVGLKFPKTSTKEFKQLNRFLGKMTQKAQSDYLTLKEFTENASHEMQTPIAIAKGKLELMLESPELNEQQAGLIQGAYQAIAKLSSIGHSLTLLNKIENREFYASEKINFSHLVEKAVETYRELAELKNITLDANLQPNVSLTIEKSLADILVSNLIKNAIQHNHPGGWIKLQLDEQYLSVKNSGAPPSVEPKLLFERFKKGNQSGGSLGLGLSIVKKIAEACDWEVSYDFEKDAHYILVAFKGKK